MPSGKKNLCCQKIKTFPDLENLLLFCCIPQYIILSVPIKICKSGMLIATNGSKYDTLNEWFTNEMKPLLPKKEQFDPPQCNRDFFDKPGRQGHSLQEILSILENGDVTSKEKIKSSHKLFLSNLSNNSPMAETELVLFSLFRVSGFNLDNINIQQLKELVSIIFKSDDIEYSLNNDLIKYVTNEINLLKCRFCLYMDMLKAFLSFKFKFVNTSNKQRM